MNSKDYVLSVRIKNDKEGPQTGDVVLNGSAVNEWLPDAEYEEGDVVVFNSQFYQAKEDIDKDMDFDPDKWNQIGVPNMYVPDFEPQTRYTKDQVVSYDGQIYKAKEDFVSKDKFYEDDWISLAGTSYEFTSEDKTVTLTINGDTIDFSIFPYINQTKKEIDKKINNKVDKEEGKVLSSNDFTDEQKEKLHNLVEILSIGDNLTLSEDGRLDAGFSISFDPSLDKESTNAVQNKAISTKIEELEKTDAETKDAVASNTSEIKKNRTDIDKNTSDIESFQSTTEALTSELNNKVDKEEGKSLSSNDYTDTDQTKLNSLASIYKIGKNLSLDGNTLNADDQRITLEETTGESHSAGMTQAAITQAIQSAASKIENDLAPVATSGSYEDLSDTPEGETLTIKTNDTIAGTFTTLSGTDEEIVIKVPTTAADIGALSSSESFAQSVSLTIDPLTFKVALQLYDQSERPLGEAQEIDLPLESVVVSGSYDNEKKEIILTLQDGSQVEVPVADLIAGLATTEQVDEKVAAEATRAKKAEEANAAAIEELKSKETTDSEAIEDLQDRLTTAEGNIKSNTQNIETKTQEAKDYTDEKVSAQADELKAYVDTKSSEAQTAAETFATDVVDSAKTELNGKITKNSEAIQKAQEDIGTLQTSGSDLDAKIDEAVSALEEADTALGQRITEESSARTEAEKTINDNIAANSEKITTNENAIKTETAAREEAVSSLDTRVTATETSTTANKKQIDTNTKDIATNKASIATNTSDITEIKDTTVVKSVAVNGTASTDTVKVDVGSGTIGDGSETKTLPLPVASRTRAGVMNAATFTAVEEMKEGLSALANEAVAVEGVITDKSSQAEITAAWKEASGSEYEEPIPGASIFDTENKVMYRYYGNTKAWALVQDGLAAEVKISLATNTQAGIVKGSTELGQSFVESNGSLSLNGWDDINNSVNDLKTNAATKNELATKLNNYPTKDEVKTQIESATGDSSPLKEEIDNLSTTVGTKQDKLTAGNHITISNNTISSDIDLMPTTGFRFYHAQGKSVTFTQDQLNFMNRKPVVGDWFYTPMWESDTSKKVRYLARYQVTAVTSTSFTATVNFLYDFWGGNDLTISRKFTGRYQVGQTTILSISYNLSRIPVVGEYTATICADRYYTLFQITATSDGNATLKSIYEVDLATPSVTSAAITEALKSYTTTTDLNAALAKKQNTLTAGDNIIIDGNTISATAKPYTLPTASADTLGGIKVGKNLSIDGSGVLSASADPYTLPAATTAKLGGIKVGTNLNIIEDGTLSAVDTKYTAGTNIQIGTDNKISATNTTYTAGNGLSLTGTAFSVDTATIATAASVAAKQDKIKAGTNIQIGTDGATISATDTKYTAGTNVQISSSNVISATNTKYTAGSGISISGTIISATAQVTEFTDAEWNALFT